jgi:hypothetical protein
MQFRFMMVTQCKKVKIKNLIFFSKAKIIKG